MLELWPELPGPQLWPGMQSGRAPCKPAGHCLTAIELTRRSEQGVCCCTPGELPINWLDAKYWPGSCCRIDITAQATPKGRELIICLFCDLIACTDCVPIL